MVLWVVTMDGHVVDLLVIVKVEVVSMEVDTDVIANLVNLLLDMVVIDVVLILVLLVEDIIVMEQMVQVIAT